jgi:hypothetical protein
VQDQSVRFTVRGRRTAVYLLTRTIGMVVKKNAVPVVRSVRSGAALRASSSSLPVRTVGYGRLPGLTVLLGYGLVPVPGRSDQNRNNYFWRTHSCLATVERSKLPTAPVQVRRLPGRLPVFVTYSEYRIVPAYHASRRVRSFLLGVWTAQNATTFGALLRMQNRRLTD